MKKENVIEVLLSIGLEEDDLSFRTNADGSEWVNTYCPLAEWTHDGGSDSSPSFGVMVDEEAPSVAHCYTCGSSHLINLVRKMEAFSGEDLGQQIMATMLYERDTAPPDLDTLRRRNLAKAKKKRPTPLDETRFTRFPLVARCREGTDYLLNRRILERGWVSMGLRYDDFQKRVLVPIRDRRGLLYGVSGRTILAPDDYPIIIGKDGKQINYPKVNNYKGLQKKFHILGHDTWESGKPVLVHESLMGQVYLMGIGADQYFNLACILGSNMSPQQAAKLAQLGEPTYLLLDNNLAGSKGIYGPIDPETGLHKGGGAIDLLKNHVPVIIPKWEDGMSDPDELTINHIKDFL